MWPNYLIESINMALVVQTQKAERLHRVESESYVFPRGSSLPHRGPSGRGFLCLVEAVLG